MNENNPSDSLLRRIREENLNVYRASPQRIREDVGQESQIAQDYRGRLVYELLQNADDALAEDRTEPACIRFLLTDDSLWVANSGRPLDEADVRGLCGISASRKAAKLGRRRASIGHKGMGFKSVLEISEAPEVFSTTMSLRFGPTEGRTALQTLVDEGSIHDVVRAPITRFPWPVRDDPSEWRELRAAGMRTAFRFPLRANIGAKQRFELATSLLELPITALLFLKHLERVEIEVRSASTLAASRRSKEAWTVRRERIDAAPAASAAGSSASGTYRVSLQDDSGSVENFVLAYDAAIEIGSHRIGLDEHTWDGVETTEVSVAARMCDALLAPSLYKPFPTLFAHAD